MNPVRRYQSLLLFRKSYKPIRVSQIRPAPGRNVVFRPSRASPQINTHECKTH
jgi:hypothetical protein